MFQTCQYLTVSIGKVTGSKASEILSPDWAETVLNITACKLTLIWLTKTWCVMTQWVRAGQSEEIIFYKLRTKLNL